MSIPLDPGLIEKYKQQLLIPPVFKPKIKKDHQKDKVIHEYKIRLKQFQQQILPDNLDKTTVWGYEGEIKTKENKGEIFKSSPGATFEAIRNIPIKVTWINELTGEHLLPVDPTIHWANPNNLPMPEPPFPPFPPGFPEAQSPVPIVTHLHGGEVRSDYDGNPDAWYTLDQNITGPAFSTSSFYYPNKQLPTTLWYHDHALGITRLNVFTGLAGFYLLRDQDDPLTPFLPEREFEIPIVIQDRSFNEDGSLAFPAVGNNPGIHPYWVPEFIGNTIVVNGRTWPNLNVKRRQYRFRLLNGSNARFYRLSLSNSQSFIQIGTDGGYLPAPVELTELLLAPGERADVLIDFSSLEPGTKIIMQNDANTPFPDGDPLDPDTVGQIMQFTVLDTPSVIPESLPTKLNKIPELIPDSPKRILTLVEVMGPDGPTELLLDGQMWDAPTSEKPVVGSTEIWEIVNLTVDTHPIHLHLVQFQIENRQLLNVDEYREAWLNQNGEPPLSQPTIAVPIEPFLSGNPVNPAKNERGWKDTVRMNPGEVTRIKVRYAPQEIPTGEVNPGENRYPFNPSIGPGYVWHCHILDHEDNEMMRRYQVIAAQPDNKVSCPFEQLLKVSFDAIFEIKVEIDDVDIEIISDD